MGLIIIPVSWFLWGLGKVKQTKGPLWEQEIQFSHPWPIKPATHQQFLLPCQQWLKCGCPSAPYPLSYQETEREKGHPHEILEKVKMSPRMSWPLICITYEKNPLKLRGRDFFKNAIFMTNKDHPAQTAPDNRIRCLPVLCQQQPEAPEVCAIPFFNPFFPFN